MYNIDFFDSENEIWVDIPDYEGFYQFSSKYRFKGLPRVIQRSNSWNYPCKEQIIAINYAFEYPTIGLSKNRRKKHITVHGLIAKMFLPNPDNLKELNHKNGNKQDFNISNLERCSHKYNMRHAIDTGLQKIKCGADHPGSKIVLDFGTGIFYDSCEDAAKSNGINPSTLQGYLTGFRKNKTNLAYV